MGKKFKQYCGAGPYCDRKEGRYSEANFKKKGLKQGSLKYKAVKYLHIATQISFENVQKF